MIIVTSYLVGLHGHDDVLEDSALQTSGSLQRQASQGVRSACGMVRGQYATVLKASVLAFAFAFMVDAKPA